MLFRSCEQAHAFVSLAGPGRGIDVVLKEQLSEAFKGKKKLLREANKDIDLLKAGKTFNEVPMELFALFRPSVQPYLISWMKYDPAVEISKLKIIIKKLSYISHLFSHFSIGISLIDSSTQ